MKTNKFETNQVVKDNMGAKWIVLGYAFGMVKVRPQPEEAFKQYGAVLMPESMLYA